MRALILSGGGSRGAFQAGALSVLHDRAERFDAVYGTSVGALNAAAVAADPSLSRVGLIWRDYVDEHLFAVRPGRLHLLRWLFNRPGAEALTDYAPLKQLLREQRWVSIEAIRDSSVRFTCYSTDLTTLDPVRIDTDLLAQLEDDVALELIFSSANLAGIVRPYEWVDPRDGSLRVLVDGGYAGKVLPFDDAVDDGATDLTVISLEAPSSYDWTHPGGRRPRTRLEWEQLAGEAAIFGTARRRLEATIAARPDLRFRVIAPRRPRPARRTPLDSLDFHRDQIRAWYDDGVAEATRVCEGNDGRSDAQLAAAGASASGGAT